MDLFKTLATLPLAPAEFIITGSAILSALDLRPTNDLDLIVTPAAFAELHAAGWTPKSLSHGGHTYALLTLPPFEASCQFPGGATFADIIAAPNTTQLISGYTFTSLIELLRVKKLLGRRKDLADIALIEGTLKTQKSS